MTSSPAEARSELYMHGYQDDAVEFLKPNPYSALFIDLGLGKTIICLTLIVWLMLTQRANSRSKVLVIAPLRVAAQTWPNEIPLWEHTAEMLSDDITVIRAEDTDPEVIAAGEAAGVAFREELAFFKVGRSGRSPEDRKALSSAISKAKTAKKQEIRLRKIAEPTTLHIINREQLEWLVEQYSDWVHPPKRKHPLRKIRKSWPYKTVIIDESSSFKDYTSNRFQALAEVRVQGHIERLHELTATPASESFMGLFSQIFLMDLGERLGRRITHFRDKYFDANKYNHTYEIKDGAKEAISEKIADIALVMLAKDHLPNTPKGTPLPRWISLEPEQLALYQSFERDFVMELPDGQVIEALTAGNMAGKLVQLSSGAAYRPPHTMFDLQGRPVDKNGDVIELPEKTIVIHDQVLDDLEQLIEELDGSPLLVGYWYRSSLERLKKRFPKGVEMDKAGKRVDNWNAGEYPYMFVHPAGVGHGLNMQMGPGHDLYYFDACYSNELYTQLNGRLARQGQRQPVRIHQPRVIGTAHDDVYTKTGVKEDGQQALFDRIKRIRAQAKRRSAA